MSKYKVEVVDILSIHENQSNPRVIKDDKFKKLVESIRTFPQMLELRPIVVNADGQILGGNMRYKACMELNMEKVPVVQVSDLTPEQQSEFIIKDNVGFGEWDWDMLANVWDEQLLSQWGLDFPQFKFDSEDDKPIDNTFPKATDDDYSTFELVMLHENKLTLLDTLNQVKSNYLFEKQEDALMEIIRKYNTL